MFYLRHSKRTAFNCALAVLFLLLYKPVVWAGNSGQTIAQTFADKDDELSVDPVFSPYAEEAAAKAYDDLRDKIVEKTGLDYLFMYSLFWQNGTQGSKNNDVFTGQFDSIVRWTLFDHKTFGSGSINLHYMYLHDITSTTNASFSSALGSKWTTSDSDAANTLRAAYWAQNVWDERVKIHFGWIDAWREFNESTYAGDDRTGFAGFPVSSNSVRHVVIGALGTTIEVKAAEFLSLKIGFNDANFSAFPNDQGFAKGEFQVQGELTFNIQPPGLDKGVWRFYGYHVDKTSNNPDGAGFAISIDQEVNQALATFLRYGVAWGARRALEQTLSSGVVFKQPFGYTRDNIGLAFMWGRPTDRNLRDQYGLESYWQIQLTERIDFGPNLQMLIHPSNNPERDVEIVGGLRARIML